MSGFDKHIMEERAELLALIYLTRRDDLSATRHPISYSSDILVSLLESGRDRERTFGVEVEGVVSEKDVRTHSARWHQRTLQTGQGAYGIMPVCLFVFVMEGDQGYWRWIQEPAVHEGRSDLIFNPNMALRRLDNTEPPKAEELTKIIAAVNAWYDSRRVLVTA